MTGTTLSWLTPGRAARVAWALWGIGVIVRIVQLWVASRPGPTVPIPYGVDLGTHLSAAVLGTSAAIVGALIVARRPRNQIGWILALTGILQAGTGLANAYSAQALAGGPSQPGLLVGWLAGIVLQTSTLAIVAWALLIIPDGRLLAPRWAVVRSVVIVGVLLRTAEVGFGADQLFLIPTVANPYRAAGLLGALTGGSYELGIGFVMLIAACLLGIVALAIRYRIAPLDERRQIRWILVAGVVVLVAGIPYAVASLGGSSPGGGVAWPLSLFFLASTLIPLALLVAITRYRLYEIDRIINRAVLYGLLTAILAGVFTAGISLAQRLFVGLTGESSDSAIVLATLVVATLYAPLRKRLETIIDRGFKFEDVRFGAYRHELSRILSMVDPVLASERLVAEAVAELGATGGAVLSASGAPTATAGMWPQVLVDRLPIPGGGGVLTAIVVGPRHDGRPHDPARLDELQRVAGMVAMATRTTASEPSVAPTPTTAPARPARSGSHRGPATPD
ncbi:MAG TPA: hypothetical protein VEX41_09135 [Candidatus Eisenbacteria bacterium]|nr:hypothetical protein [Candidatus Eisenbacteria bacterium]